MITKLSHNSDEEDTLYVVLHRIDLCLRTSSSLCELEGMIFVPCFLASDMEYIENEELLRFLQTLPSLLSVSCLTHSLFLLVTKLAHAISTSSALLLRLLPAVFSYASTVGVGPPFSSLGPCGCWCGVHGAGEVRRVHLQRVRPHPVL